LTVQLMMGARDVTREVDQHDAPSSSVLTPRIGS
jgi:hypothetical protein